MNYYVDSIDGSDSNSGTSEAEPWQTLARVHAHSFQPGDVVHFKRGSSWSGGLVINDSGVEGSPITFTTYGTGSRPTFSNPGEGTDVIFLDASWVVVRSFYLHDCHEAGVRAYFNADHNVVRDCEITDVGNGVRTLGSHNLFTHNHIHDLHMIRNTETPSDDDYGAVGIIFRAGSHNEACYNVLERCRAPSYDYGYDGGAFEWYSDVDNCYVHHNWAAECQGFMEIGGGLARNNVVAYNVSFNNYGGFSSVHLGGTYGSNVENLRIENNTIIHTHEEGWRIFGWVYGVPDADTASVRNNVVYTNIQITNDAGFTHDHNLYYSPAGYTDVGFPLGEGEQVADPLFVNLEGDDFHLRPGSPAIDGGVDLGHFLDFDGRPILAGIIPNIGAYEGGLQMITLSYKYTDEVDWTLIGEIAAGEDTFQWSPPREGLCQLQFVADPEDGRQALVSETGIFTITHPVAGCFLFPVGGEIIEETPVAIQVEIQW